MEGQKQMSWWKAVNGNWINQLTYSFEEFSGEKAILFLYTSMHIRHDITWKPAIMAKMHVPGHLLLCRNIKRECYFWQLISTFHKMSFSVSMLFSPNIKVNGDTGKYRYKFKDKNTIKYFLSF